MSHGWENGLFSCFSSPGDCVVGCCCPCITYGETEHRLSHENEIEAESHSVFNGPCALYCALSALTGGLGPCLMTMFQRTKIRERLNISGGSAGDLCASWCCHCCTIIQNKSEVTDAQHHKGQYINGPMGAPIQPAMQQPMVYGEQPVAYAN